MVWGRGLAGPGSSSALSPPAWPWSSLVLHQVGTVGSPAPGGAVQSRAQSPVSLTSTAVCGRGVLWPRVLCSGTSGSQSPGVLGSSETLLGAVCTFEG